MSNLSGELRVTRCHVNQKDLYIYTRPKPEHKQILSQVGWKYCQAPIPSWETSDIELAKQTVAQLGLPLPEWGGTYCFRI